MGLASCRNAARQSRNCDTPGPEADSTPDRRPCSGRRCERHPDQGRRLPLLASRHDHDTARPRHPNGDHRREGHAGLHDLVGRGRFRPLRHDHVQGKDECPDSPDRPGDRQGREEAKNCRSRPDRSPQGRHHPRSRQVEAGQADTRRSCPRDRHLPYPTPVPAHRRRVRQLGDDGREWKIQARGRAGPRRVGADHCPWLPRLRGAAREPVHSGGRAVGGWGDGAGSCHRCGGQTRGGTLCAGELRADRNVLHRQHRREGTVRSPAALPWTLSLDGRLQGQRGLAPGVDESLLRLAIRRTHPAPRGPDRSQEHRSPDPRESQE